MSRKQFLPLLVAILFPLCGSPTPQKQIAYVFDSRGKFVKIDVGKGRILDVGNLWWLQIKGISGFIGDPKENQIVGFVLSEPIKKEGNPEHQLVLLAPDVNGDLQIFQKIRTPAVPTWDARGAYLISFSGLTIHPDGSRVYVSWNELNTAKSAVFDSKNYKVLAQASQNLISDRTCFSADGKKLYFPPSEEIIIADSADLRIIERMSISNILTGPKVLRRSVAATINTSEGCIASILEYPATRGAEEHNGMLYLVNLDHKREEGRTEIKWWGDFKILPNGHTLVADEKEFVPNKLPNGREIGLKDRKTGWVRVIDFMKPEQSRRIRVPTDGTEFWISPDGYFCLYGSPFQLTIIDLNQGKLAKTMETPFQSIQAVVFLKN